MADGSKWGYPTQPSWARRVWNFNNEVIQYPFPKQPEALGADRVKWAQDILGEELRELGEATTPAQQADAFIDFAYFAVGRLCEMGLSPAQIDDAFERVHLANMQKLSGRKPGRSDGLGFDAIKPPGWTDPDLSDLFPEPEQTYFERRHALACVHEAGICTAAGDHDGVGVHIHEPRVTAHEARRVTEHERQVKLPKLIVVGHGRHGKDTACEFLRDKFGFKFGSSSEFCAEHVVMPWLHTYTDLDYDTWQECFADRHTGDNRAHWYSAITAFNTPDKSRLGRAILERNDIYNGLRNRAELWAMQATGLVDAVVWVDRTDHVELEPRSSMTIEPWMADFHVDNNGSLDELERNLFRLAERLIKDKNK